jgi:hypothetical protein
MAVKHLHGWILLGEERHEVPKPGRADLRGGDWRCRLYNTFRLQLHASDRTVIVPGHASNSDLGLWCSFGAASCRHFLAMCSDTDALKEMRLAANHIGAKLQDNLARMEPHFSRESLVD